MLAASHGNRRISLAVYILLTLLRVKWRQCSMFKFSTNEKCPCFSKNLQRRLIIIESIDRGNIRFQPNKFLNHQFF